MNGKDDGPDSMALNPTGDDTKDEVQDSFAPVDEKPDAPPAAETLEEADDDKPKDEDDEKPKGKKGDLPREEYESLKDARKARDTAKRERDAEKARADALELENALLKAEKEDPEPDDDAPAAEIKAWARRDAERRAKIGEKKTPAAPAAPGEPTKLDKQREAVREEYDDFDRFVSKAVINRIDTDPALHDRVWTSKNPPLEAYMVGRELILGEKGKTPRLSSEGGFRPSPARGGKIEGLDRDQKRVANIFGVSEKEMVTEINKKRGAR